MIQELLAGGGSTTTTTSSIPSSSPIFLSHHHHHNHHHGDRKISMITSDQAGFLQASLSFPPPPTTTTNLPSSTATITPPPPYTTVSTAAGATTPAEPQNLRCPRCDSTNTKFCYYNNYNLTQPRHFCKTCRRYWTKGGALRNVPIGGGCRKNKVSPTTSSGGGGGSASNGKPFSKAKSCGLSLADITGVSSSSPGGFGFGFGFESHHHNDLSSVPSSNSPPVFWPPPPPPSQSSHILALLRSAQNPNPNNQHNTINALSTTGFTLKNDRMLQGGSGLAPPKLELGGGGHVTAKMFGVGTHDEPYDNNTQSSSSSSAHSNASSVGMSNSLWRSNHQIQQGLNNGLAGPGESQSGGGGGGGFQELFQRLKPAGGANNKGSRGQYQYLGADGSTTAAHQMMMVLGNTNNNSNVSSSSTNVISTSSTGMAAPVTVLNGSEYGCFKSPLSWSDHHHHHLPTASGSTTAAAYP